MQGIKEGRQCKTMPTAAIHTQNASSAHIYALTAILKLSHKVSEKRLMNSAWPCHGKHVDYVRLLLLSFALLQARQTGCIYPLRYLKVQISWACYGQHESRRNALHLVCNCLHIPETNVRCAADEAVCYIMPGGRTCSLCTSPCKSM